MGRLLFAAAFVFLSADGYAQPAIEWHHTWGGGGVDQAKSIRRCTDGGYIVAGHTTSANGDVTGNHGSYDYWVLKLDGEGNLEWQKTLGGTGADWATSVEQDLDGGFVVAGYTISNNGDVTGHHGDYDYWVTKLDEDGNLEWQKTFGGTGIDQAKSIQVCADGGYIVAGSTWSDDGDVDHNHGSDDCWIVKLDSAGVLQWQASFGGTGNDMANAVRQTADGGYVLAGYSNSGNGDVSGNHGGYDYWLVKLNHLGGMQWEKSLGGSGDDQAYSIEQTADGGYIVAGFSDSDDMDVTSPMGAYDYWMVKLDSMGAIQWQKSLGGSAVENAYSVKPTVDGGYVVAGYSNSGNNVVGGHGSFDYWVVKLSDGGALQWQKTMGGGAVDQAYAVDVTNDGGYIVAGYTTSSDGDLSDDNINGDYWVIKLEGGYTGMDENNSAGLHIFPNPTADIIQIRSDEPIQSVTVRDLTGRLVQTGHGPAFSVKSLPAGLYVLYAQTGKIMTVSKFIKE